MTTRTPRRLAAFVVTGSTFAAAALAQPAATIRSAVEVSYTAEAGQSHQLQTSGDLQTWANHGAPVAAQTGTVTEFFPVTQPRQFYRVVTDDLVDISATLTSVRSTYNLPVLGCLVIADGKVAALGVVGNRKQGIAEPATVNDLWHHGSNTKSMTATLAAILVEEGAISWTTTVGAVFPEKVSGMASGWSAVTLEQLLSNTGGAPGAIPSGTWTTLWNFTGTPRDARIRLLELITASALRYAPGTGYEYSNAGFSIAGAMLERVADRAWEDLITEKLFRPLGMERTSFGVPGTPRHIFQPWGHTRSGSTNVPIEPGTNADNPPAIGPAGTVHAPLLDLARYVQFHLAGARGETGSLLSSASFAKLHASVANNNYALGWGVSERDWAGGRTLSHNGSNTYWFSTIWIAPEKNWACIVVTNYGSTNAGAATDAMVWAMVQQFLLNE